MSSRTSPSFTSPIQKSVALQPVSSATDLFVNAHPLYHPAGARAVYGGAAVGQSVAAAKCTVSADFAAHSMHCTFVLAGNADHEVYYYVERIRDGKNFATRTVQARQQDRCIFTATVSFVRVGSATGSSIEHATKIPNDVQPPPDMNSLRDLQRMERLDPGFRRDDRPFESVRYPHNMPRDATQRKERAWIRARGRIADNKDSESNIGLHQAAFAYLSDSYLLGAITRVNGVSNVVRRPTIDSKMETFAAASHDDQHAMQDYLKSISYNDFAQPRFKPTIREGGKGEVDVIVSLNHSIFFHHPQALKADEWMFTETTVPWAGEDRGLVTQHIWSKEGVLVATCTQEGLVRLRERGKERL
ncbi:putative acyl-CoA thioesterase [Lophiotrema nucula]|uniref:Putative acyl-CoA thioesterase n=1 Tax=Lophiotrema nucula TaxID=690887 RepID=A0A6A5YXX7_9PLEO|nr:putative acyl-CoA thioesterase [Lophiotrema nucula]